MPFSRSSASENDARDEAKSMRAYRVVGRVQGVGYRDWTRRTADRLGISGSVRNLPDGSVEVQARGRDGDLRRLEEELRRGPVMARVDRVETLTPDPSSPTSEFRVLH
jgi:acylphosphatase